MFEAAEQRAKLRAAGVPESVIGATDSSTPSWATWVIAGIWIGMSLYALYLNPEYVRWRAARIGRSSEIRPSQASAFATQPTAWSPPVPHGSVVQYITVNGGDNNFNTQSTSVQAGGNVSGISGSHVEQSATSAGLPTEVLLAFIDQYRAALTGLDVGTQHAAEPRLKQLAAEVTAAQPNGAVINQNLQTLKALAHHALSAGIAKAATTGGSAAMSALLAQWPFG
jgi:hypothetical protein